MLRQIPAHPSAPADITQPWGARGLAVGLEHGEMSSWSTGRAPCCSCTSDRAVALPRAHSGGGTMALGWAQPAQTPWHGWVVDASEGRRGAGRSGEPSRQQRVAAQKLCKKEMSKEPTGLTDGFHRLPPPLTRSSLCWFGHIPYPTDPHYPTCVHRSSP